MYLAQIKLWNFRKFGSSEALDLDKPNLDLPLRNGLNVLVGENDSGKSAIIDAIRLEVPPIGWTTFCPIYVRSFACEGIVV